MDDTTTQLAPRSNSQRSPRELAELLKIPYATSLKDYSPHPEFLARVPIGFARKQMIIGLVGESPDQPLVLALTDIAAWDQIDVIGRFLGACAAPLLAPREAVADAINCAYETRSGETAEAIEAIDRNEVLADLSDAVGKEDLLDVAARAPVIKIVNLMLFEAVKALASDVHLHPYEDKLIVRMRIDGVLYDSFALPKRIQDEVTSRIKVMGKMNIAEKRLPQDGRATVQVGDRLIDLRLASLPTSYGERVVIRLLDKSARLYRLAELGMSAQEMLNFRAQISAEHGLLLVTGPTGSGKTTTLYAALKELDFTQKNILTLEDPIEYQLEGISQTQVSNKKGMTFASGLRSVLRQDPDVIMVGEIRDHETASMAIQSALTGHLVFSTLHTNDASSAITRLMDLGVEPYLVASSLIGVLAQRLVRRVCAQCGETTTCDEKDSIWLAMHSSAPTFGMRKGRGCEACRSTGFRGRDGIFELLTVSESLRTQIQGRVSAAQIKAAAMHDGMRTLRADGVAKILSGLTTIAEVQRVTGSDGDESGELSYEPTAVTPEAARQSEPSSAALIA